MGGKHKTGRSGRHRFHALCPYFAMFPESFAGEWIGRLTKPGDTILDPFCGRGTAPFQALLMGRNAIGSDINPVAYCITRAKTNAPSCAAVKGRLTSLNRRYSGNHWEMARKKLPQFFKHAYSPHTLRQILYLRATLKWRQSDVDCMIAALVLGILHGESEKSPSYLSNQMPRTISTKPAYSIRFWRSHGSRAPKRDAFLLLRNRLEYRYESDTPANTALVLQADVRELPRFSSRFMRTPSCAITSPPYLNVTNFEEDQWLRLWFLGGAPNPTYGRVSKDDRHERPEAYWSLISDMWRVLGCILAPRADVVIRLGGKDLDPDRIVGGLTGTSVFSARRTALVSHEVSAIRNRQTDAFRPGSQGCRIEVDCHFSLA